MEQTVSIREVVGLSVRTLRNNLFFFIQAVFIFLALNFILSALGIFFGSRDFPLFVQLFGLAIQIFGLFLGIVMSIGFLKITLACVDGKEKSISDLFIHYRFFLKYLGANIVFWLSSAGVLLMAVLFLVLLSFFSPGSTAGGSMPILWQVVSIFFGLVGIVGLAVMLFLGTRFVLFGYFIVDTELGPIRALKTSFKITKDFFWSLLGFFVLIFFISVFTLFFSGVAEILISLIVFFFIFPLTLLSIAFLYRKLSHQTSSIFS